MCGRSACDDGVIQGCQHLGGVRAWAQLVESASCLDGAAPPPTEPELSTLGVSAENGGVRAWA
jgi:hypothetical protein